MPMMAAGSGCSRAVWITLVASALEPSLNTLIASIASCCGVSLPAMRSTGAIHGRARLVDLRLDLVGAFAAAVGARHWIFA